MPSISASLEFSSSHTSKVHFRCAQRRSAAAHYKRNHVPKTCLCVPASLCVCVYVCVLDQLHRMEEMSRNSIWSTPVRLRLSRGAGACTCNTHSVGASGLHYACRNQLRCLDLLMYARRRLRGCVCARPPHAQPLGEAAAAAPRPSSFREERDRNMGRVGWRGR